MAEQVYYGDIDEGSEIKPMSKIATTRMLVQWAGACGDFNPLHYDEEFAKAMGVGTPIVQGTLKRAWLVNYIEDWIGEEGELVKLSCQFRGIDYPRRMKGFDEPKDGETWLCKGKITKKRIEGNKHLVDCDIWVENGKGEKTTPGIATVILPSRD